MLPARPKQKIPTLAIDNSPELVTNPAIALNPARYALKQVNDAWDKLRAAEMASSDHKRLARAAQGVVALADKVTTESLKHLEDFRKMIESKLASEIQPKSVDPAAAEIRAHWKNQRHPFATLGALVKQNDRRTLAAILTVPAYLSGLTPEQHQVLLDTARETWFSEDTATLKDINHHAGRVMMLAAHVKKTLSPLIAEWSGEKEEKAFSALNGGVS